MNNNFVIFEGNSELGSKLVWTGTKNFNIGDIVLKLEGKIFDEPTRTSIQINENQHIDCYLGRFVNHSSTPNCKVENRCLIAITKIKENDSITFDYNETEYELAHPFKCIETGKWVVGKKFQKTPINNNLNGEWYNNQY